MRVNEKMRGTLMDLSTKLQSVERNMNRRMAVDYKIRLLELQEHCETLLEDVTREFGNSEKHIDEINHLETSVNDWLGRLENEKNRKLRKHPTDQRSPSVI